MTPIKDFCRERGIKPKIEEAFIAYVRASYSQSYAIKPGETLSKIMEKMTREKVEDAWQKFIVDFKETLVS